MRINWHHAGGQIIMRYLLITYYTKPSGSIDESIEITKNLRRRDLQLCNVILDFKEKSILKASMNGVVVPKNWDRIVDYYRQHYASAIEDLIKTNSPLQ
jgi:hypothetical protein